MYGTKVYYFSKLALEFPLLFALPLIENSIKFDGI